MSLSYSNALVILLTTETLFLAVISLAVTIAIPSARGVPNLPVSPFVLALSAVVALGLIAAGAGFAWAGIYLPHYPHEVDLVAISVALMVAIVVEPFFALLLVLGIRVR
jgi:hypothetical protein